jgi:YgiT-type zinc finger domain-containing protein
VVSAAAEWEKGASGVVCPRCGAKLEKKGKKKRKLDTQGGREVELIREYGVCPKCGQGLFPPG